MQRNVTSILRALLAPALVALVAATGCASTTRTAETPVAAPAAAQTSAVDQRILGPADAPVMIIEFTDLQCPYCARFARDTWPLLRERYVDTGKIRFATRDLPLPIHEFALPAAVAARCAGQQGKFWEYREALFRDQSLLSQGRYAELAGEFGLDRTRFESCRADPAVLAAVRADAALAASSGISSTPSFVIGRVVNGEFAGEVMSGAKPFEVFQQRLDSLLQQQSQK
jgi:protein-disulfide isomerase